MGLGGFSSTRRIANTGGDAARKILREGSKMHVYNMKCTNGSVLFRPWMDTFIDANGMVQNAPERSSENPDELLSTWFGMEAFCTQCGLDFKFDCVASCSDPQDWGGSSPLLLFKEAAWAAAKNNKGLKDLLFREYTPGVAGFPGLTIADKGVLKGALFQTDGTRCTKNINGVDTPSPVMPTLLLISISAAKWLEVACTHRNSDGTLALENVASFAYGSVLEFDFEDKIMAGQDIDPTKGFSRSAAKAKGDSGKGGPRYHSGRVRRDWDQHVRIVDQPTLLALHELNEKFADALYYMSGREQIEECILPGFGGQLRELILSVFQARGVLPDAYVNARTFSTPGNFGAPAVPGVLANSGVALPGSPMSMGPATVAQPPMSMGAGMNMGMSMGANLAPNMAPQAQVGAPAGVQLNPGVAAMAAGMGVQGAQGLPQAQAPVQPLVVPGALPQATIPNGQVNVGAVSVPGAGSPADLAAQLDSRMASIMGNAGVALPGGAPQVQAVPPAGAVGGLPF